MCEVTYLWISGQVERKSRRQNVFKLSRLLRLRSHLQGKKPVSTRTLLLLHYCTACVLYIFFSRNLPAAISRLQKF